MSMSKQQKTEQPKKKQQSPKKKTTRSQRQKPPATKYAYKGANYFVILKNGKATVRTQSTAYGQNLIVGVWDIETGLWHNDKTLPTAVKQKVEKAFAHPQI